MILKIKTERGIYRKVNKLIKSKIKNYNFNFITNEKVFSPKYIDKGTLAMLSIVTFKKTIRFWI